MARPADVSGTYAGSTAIRRALTGCASRRVRFSALQGVGRARESGGGRSEDEVEGEVVVSGMVRVVVAVVMVDEEEMEEEDERAEEEERGLEEVVVAKDEKGLVVGVGVEESPSKER